MGDAFDLQFGLVDLSVTQSVDVGVEVFELYVDVLAVWHHLMDLVVEGAVGPGERFSVSGVGSFEERLFRRAILKHADHADQLIVYFFQILVSDFLMSDRFPEHSRQI